MIDEQVEKSVDEGGCLELNFSRTPSDAALVSLDGNRTLAWVAPSGEITCLLVQDYVNDETRTIPFEFGEIDVINEEGEVCAFLRPSSCAALPRHGPSLPSRSPSRRRS